MPAIIDPPQITAEQAQRLHGHRVDLYRARMVKLGETLKAGRNVTLRSVTSSDGRFFETIRKASEATGLSQRQIRNALQRKTPAGGATWSYHSAAPGVVGDG